MKAVAIIVNFFIPGIGSMILGKVGQGITQLILWIVGGIISFSVVGAIIGVPLCIAAWIWGLVTAASTNPQPIQVHVVTTNQSPPIQ